MLQVYLSYGFVKVQCPRLVFTYFVRLSFFSYELRIQYLSSNRCSKVFQEGISKIRIFFYIRLSVERKII